MCPVVHLLFRLGDAAEISISAFRALVPSLMPVQRLGIEAQQNDGFLLISF
jgi:hypothetical protein